MSTYKWDEIWGVHSELDNTLEADAFYFKHRDHMDLAMNIMILKEAIEEGVILVTAYDESEVTIRDDAKEAIKNILKGEMSYLIGEYGKITSNM